MQLKTLGANPPAMRPAFVLGVFLLGHLFSAPFASAQFDICQDREWSDYTGQFKVIGKLTGIEDDRIQILRASGGDAKVRLHNLADNDKAYIQAFTSLRNTTESVEQSGPLFANSRNSLAEIESSGRSHEPASVVKHHQLVHETADKLLVIHDKQGDLVAGMLGSTLLSLGKDPTFGHVGRQAPVQIDDGNLRRATRHFESVVSELRNCEMHFPGKLTITLTSALNNLAVTYLKAGQPARASRLLSDACGHLVEVQAGPWHNANVLLDLGADKKGLFSLSLSQIRQLKESIGERVPKDDAKDLPPVFVCSFDFDGAAEESSSDVPFLRADRMRTLNLVPELTCFICQGKGFVGCRNCANGIVNTSAVRPLGIDPNTGRPIVAVVPAATSCKTCSGRGLFVCNQCDHGQINLPSQR